MSDATDKTQADDNLVIDVDSITKTFEGNDAVHNVSFEVPRGDIFCLLGPSGSGKTTTIRMILAIYAPDKGDLKVFGKPPESFGRSLYKRIGYMPQQFVLYPTLTIEENLNFIGQLYGVGLRKRRRRIHEMLEFLELKSDRGKSAGELSGGMQRRVALAAAFLHEPELLILDEPTAAIDPILRAKFWEEFKRLNEEGTTLFVTTQYVSEATNAKRVAILSEGNLVALDTPGALRHQAYGGEVVDIQAAGVTAGTVEFLRNHPKVIAVEDASYDFIRLIVADSDDVPEITSVLDERNIDVRKTTEVDPAFDDVFVRLVQDHRSATAPEMPAEGRVGAPIGTKET